MSSRTSFSRLLASFLTALLLVPMLGGFAAADTSPTSMVGDHDEDPIATASEVVEIHNVGPDEVLAGAAATDEWIVYTVRSRHVDPEADWGESTIYAFNLRTSEAVLVSDQPGIQVLGDAFGDWIVWEDWSKGTSDSDVWAFNLETRETFEVCTAPNAQLRPVIVGGKVVWNDFRDGYHDGSPYHEIWDWEANCDVYCFDLQSRIEEPLANLPDTYEYRSVVDVERERIVIADRAGSAGGVRVYEASSGTMTETEVNNMTEWPVQLVGDALVYEVARYVSESHPFDRDLWAWNLQTGERMPVCVEDFDRVWAGGSWGDTLFYVQEVRSSPEEEFTNHWDMYAFDTVEGTAEPVATHGGDYSVNSFWPPRVADGVLFWWQGSSRLEGYWDFCALDLLTGERTILNAEPRWSPGGWAAAGDAVAWLEGDSLVGRLIRPLNADTPTDHDDPTDPVDPGDPTDPSDPDDPDDEELPPVISIAGGSRYETAVEASKLAFPDGADTVVIATGRNWPDALGGTALAGALDAPILLVATDSVPEVVPTEIARLKATKAVIVGGEAAVEPAVATALTSVGLTVERVAGANRYETADEVALRVIDLLGDTYDGTAFVATGGAYADAVAAGPLAASQGWPLFLAHPTGGLRTHTTDAMADVTDALVLGGEAAVSAETHATLAGLLGAEHIERLAGGSRYETAVKIAEHAVEHTDLAWNRVGIATGQAYPDALAGGVLQGKVGSVMLFTRTASLPDETAGALADNKAAISTVTYFGGELAVSAQVRADVGQVLQ